MASILNVFSNKKSNKQPNITKIPPSLKHGKKFKNYQNKIESSLEKNAKILSGKEGFSDMEDKGLTKQTNNIIGNNDFSNQQQIIGNLRQEYQNTIHQYEKLVNKISGNLTNYVDRVNPNNPYLNKVIQFTTGDVCYVTSKGLVKHIPSDKVWKSSNIPQSIQVSLDIPYIPSYGTPGTQIPTNPPLIAGTRLQMDQNVGNEGSNVFVSELLPSDTTPTYMGCYAVNSSNDNMAFIGDSPPTLTDVTIQNGTFSQPVLTNNSFRYITSASEVPGWYFGGAALLNNSSAWGYPRPYPGGNQCVSIQRTQYINVLLELNTGVDYTITFSGCSRNCCMNPNVGNPIDIKLYSNLNAYISTIANVTPPVNSWTNYSYTFTAPTTQSYKLYFSGTYNSGDQSTAIANVSLNSSIISGTGGNYSYEQCKQEAIISGNRFFALQNVNLSTGLGYCAVSNSQPAVSQYGEAQVPSKAVALWASKTYRQPGNTAILDGGGSLEVLNSSGTSVFSTPIPDSSKPSEGNYLGCYKMPNRWSDDYRISGTTDHSTTFNECQDLATENGINYFAYQGYLKQGNSRRCLGFNDLGTATSNGNSKNCKSETRAGGGAGVLYSLSEELICYLILQDDGNMVIYRGTSPSDNQGLIWETGTNGKQQSANPQMVSTNGKYGQNWIASGSTLAPGDFIGSNDGSLALVMQTDGNLVLYTYQMETNCQKMSDGNMGGGVGGNAAYDIGKTAVSGNMGALGYIDGDSNLYTYPSTNQTYNSNYTTINDMDTPGNDIQGASFSNTTLDSCQTACNNNSECAGFVFSGNTCWPKTNQLFPFSNSLVQSKGTQIYVRGRMPSSPPLGVSQSTNITDSLTYQKYIKKGEVGSEYGLANATTDQKQELEQLQSRMNLLSRQITDLTNKFQGGTLKAENQNEKNNTGIQDYLKDIITTNKKIDIISGETIGNIHNILTDSDIVVLQKNYNYLFWSILAAGTVLVSMNIVKKQ